MPKNKLAKSREDKGETLFKVFQRTGFKVSRLSDIERGFALPTLEETVQLAEIYGVSRSGVAKITNAGWEGKDIKEQVEQIASLGIAADRARERDDCSAIHVSRLIHEVDVERYNIERQLSDKHIMVIKDNDNSNVLHIYINGERWRDFDVFEKQWKAIEENEA